MRVTEALGQIEQIHRHLTRSEVYRGFHPLGVALSGVSGVIAAAVQPWFIAAHDATGFVRYWFLIAAVSAGVGTSRALDAYLWREDEASRRRTRQVLGQFLPCVASGLVLTLGLGRSGVESVFYLPGLWAVLFALGVFATRLYLPVSTGWVGLFYFSAGATLLMYIPSDLTMAGWSVGGVFGAGQLAMASVLGLNRERPVNA